jgi:hypothetical protein
MDEIDLIQGDIQLQLLYRLQEHSTTKGPSGFICNTSMRVHSIDHSRSMQRKSGSIEPPEFQLN